ncbi:MAG: hypothetical protein AAB969_00800, partial [Patescibacteria group bacterium]
DSDLGFVGKISRQGRERDFGVQGRGGRARIPSPQTPSHFLPAGSLPRPWNFSFWDLNLGKILGFFLKKGSNFVRELRLNEVKERR